MMSDATETSRAATALAARIAGASLIAAALGFMAVFAYLAARFDYPGVLDGVAANVLPALVALGESGRAVWTVYALLPLLLIPAAVGATAALEEHATHAMRAARIFGVIAAISMLIGLARWPTLHWELALAYPHASAHARAAIDVTFAGLNRYLGNFIGEFLGEMSLNAFFLLTGFGLVRNARQGFGYAGMAAGVIGLAASLRNVTSLVAPIAQLNNYVLPLWLIVMGIVLLRWHSPLALSPAPHAIRST